MYLLLAPNRTGARCGKLEQVAIAIGFFAVKVLCAVSMDGRG